MGAQSRSMLKETKEADMAFYKAGSHPWDVDNRKALDNAWLRFDIVA